MQFQQRHRSEEKRREVFGETRPIIATTVRDHRIVGVGNTVYWGQSWKTFPDFLCHYIVTTLGSDWGNSELAKPATKQHPIIQWYTAFCELRARDKESTEPDENGVYTSVLDGPSQAYLLLAYDLYVLRDHAALQESLLRRLKHRDQFQGARYELFVTATMIRAGCSIDFEDESDPSRKHTEFTAAHRSTGQKVSVEAKSRHRPGVLGRKGTAASASRFRLGLRHLLRSALEKATNLPYFIFIDANMPPEVASTLSLVDWRKEVHETVRSFESGMTETGIIVGSKFNMLAVTNTPDHYGEVGRETPGYDFYLLTPSTTTNRLEDQCILEAVRRALNQAANIPQHFPDD